jgi:hypothetical protein
MNNYNTSAHDSELEGLIDAEKVNLSNSYNQSFSTMEQTLELIIAGLRHSEHNNFKDTKLLYNIAGYINIIAYDLKIITKDLSFSRNEWEKRVYTRQASLILYEAVGDLLKLLGKDFKNITKNRLDITEYEDGLNNIRGLLNVFKETNFQRLYKVRNVATAHRDKDILKQIDTILQINCAEMLNLLFEFNKIVYDLAKIIMQIITKALSELEELTTCQVKL